MLLALFTGCYFLSHEQLADRLAELPTDSANLVGGDSAETGDTGNSDTSLETGDLDSGETGDSGTDTGLETGDSDSGETGTETGFETGGEETGDPGCDVDGDSAASEACGGSDCDDADPDIYPDATEVCNGIDDNCDGGVDVGAVDADLWYADLDGDGYGDPADVVAECLAPVGRVVAASDCDDTDSAIHPGGTETCDAVDTDCDGYLDGPLGVPSAKATIQQALDAASDGDTICIEAGSYTETLNAYDLTIALEGAGSGSTTVKSDGSDRAFTWSDSVRRADLQVSGITFRDGESVYGAGMYLLGGSVVLSDVVVEENTCTSAGDCMGTGIYLVADAEFTDVVLRDNRAAPASCAETYLYGVGIYAYDATVSWANVVVSGNEANGENAANQAYVIGIGVSFSSVDLDGSNIEITENRSTRGSSGPLYMYGQGAGLAADGGSLLLTDTVVGDNVFEYTSTNDSAFGGGAFLSAVDGDFTRMVIGGNEVHGGTAAGSAMYGYGAFALYFANLLVLNNDAYAISAGYGSISLMGSGTATITNADFYENGVDGGLGAYGGGAFVGSGTTLALDSTTMMANTCVGTTTPACGGAIYLDGTSSAGSSAYTNYYANSPGDVGGVVTMVDEGGNFVGDPAYTWAKGADYSAWDLQLLAVSPCIDTGNSAVLDVDGTRADVGGYGGPGGSW